MNKTKNVGVITVRVINPKDLATMDDDEIVIVNRVQVSSKIVEFEIRNSYNSRVLLLKHAFRDMKSLEKKSRSTVLGARMYVKDVKDIFPEYASLPKNSFVYALEQKTKG